jgi:hypothetical protein
MKKNETSPQGCPKGSMSFFSPAKAGVVVLPPFPMSKNIFELLRLIDGINFFTGANKKRRASDHCFYDLTFFDYPFLA